MFTNRSSTTCTSTTIEFFLVSLEDFEREAFAGEIIDIFMSLDPPMQPNKYDLLKGKRKIKDPEMLVDAFLGRTVKYPCPEQCRTVSLLLSCNEDVFDYQVAWDKYVELPEPVFQMIAGGAQISALEENIVLLDAFLNLVRRLSKVIKPVYGDIKSAAFPGWSMPVDLAVRLPDIRPISIYGAPYIEFFGRQAIESAPFKHIEKLSPDLYWLEANDSVFEQVAESDKQAIREHFGEDAFMAGKKWRYSSGRAPTFDFTNILF
jgi:hypothetical protein